MTDAEAMARHLRAIEKLQPDELTPQELADMLEGELQFVRGETVSDGDILRMIEQDEAR